MAIKIDHSKCGWKGGTCSCSCDCGSSNSECEGCAEVCPVEAIKREDIVKVDESKCIECGACVDACPYNAISLVKKSIKRAKDL